MEKNLGTMDTDIAKWLAALETKVLRRMFGGIKVNENWRKGYNKELIQVLGDLDILSFVTTAGLNWSGLMDRMDRISKLSLGFNSSHQGSRM